MVVKIYISGISGNKEVKKRQQRVLMILDSKNIEYEIIDITEPGKELDKEFMQANGIARDSKYPLPPQIFNEETYCGDYEDFDTANEIDLLEEFLYPNEAPSKAAVPAADSTSSKEIQENGNTTSREPSTDKDAALPPTDSSEDRTAPSDAVQPEVSKSVEEIRDVKNSAEEEAELMEDNADKNEEKSDDQEKEE